MRGPKRNLVNINFINNRNFSRTSWSGYSHTFSKFNLRQRKFSKYYSKL